VIGLVAIETRRDALAQLPALDFVAIVIEIIRETGKSGVVEQGR
jgi:hypothetical protein